MYHSRGSITTEYNYESNAIEGNTLLLAETELVLSRGITVSGKPLKDHPEATNHQKALTHLQQLVDKRDAFDELSLLHGYPLTIIRSEDNQRVDYYHALAESDRTDTREPFRRFIERRVHESLEEYLAVMEQAK